MWASMNKSAKDKWAQEAQKYTPTVIRSICVLYGCKNTRAGNKTASDSLFISAVWVTFLGFSCETISCDGEMEPEPRGCEELFGQWKNTQSCLVFVSLSVNVASCTVVTWRCDTMHFKIAEPCNRIRCCCCCSSVPQLSVFRGVVYKAGVRPEWGLEPKGCDLSNLGVPVSR